MHPTPACFSAPLRTLLTLVFAVVIAAFAPRAHAQTNPVSITISPQVAAVKPDTWFVLAVGFEHDEHWHTQASGDYANAITVKGGGVTLGVTQWPKTKTIKMDLEGTGTLVEVRVYEGSALAFVPIKLSSSAGGAPGVVRPLEVKVSYQACDDRQCLPPKIDKKLIEVKVDPAAPAPAFTGAFANVDQTGFARAAPQSTATPAGPTPSTTNSNAVAFNVLGRSFTVGASGVGFVLLLLLAALGGLILNLTPCVLPVIPLKIMSLTKAAGSPKRAKFLGIVMALGVVAFWLALGVLVVSTTSIKGASQLSGIWWFTLAIGLFMLLMGLGSLGLFTVGLPQWVYTLNPRQDTALGALLFGLLTALLATPCVAPFMGGAVGWAATQPAASALPVFTAVGVGMALPYVVLAFFPGLVRKVPKAGPAGDLLKQVLGLLMIAVSAFFIGVSCLTLAKSKPYLGGVIHWWIIAGVVVAAAGWLAIKGGALAMTFAGKALVLACAGVLAFVPLWLANRFTQVARDSQAWKHFTPEALAAARAAKKTILLDFTAEWCNNCKLLKATVLSRAAVNDLLTQPDVAAFEVDLTVNEDDRPEWKLLFEYGRTAPPLLVIEGPGDAERFASDFYTVADVVDAITRRRASR